jgi:hypothetical protein
MQFIAASRYCGDSLIQQIHGLRLSLASGPWNTKMA